MGKEGLDTDEESLEGDVLLLDDPFICWGSGESGSLLSHGMGESSGVLCPDCDELAEEDETEEATEDKDEDLERSVWVVSPPRGWVMLGCKLAEGNVTKDSSGGKSDWALDTPRQRCKARMYLGKVA